MATGELIATICGSIAAGAGAVAGGKPLVMWLRRKPDTQDHVKVDHCMREHDRLNTRMDKFEERLDQKIATIHGRIDDIFGALSKGGR